MKDEIFTELLSSAHEALEHSQGKRSLGLSHQQILEELPDVQPEDIAACLRFASRRIDHPIVAA